MKKSNQTALQGNAGLEPASLDFSHPVGDTLEIRFSGTWRIGQTIPSTDDLEKQLDSEPGVEKITFDTVALNGWDSGLLTFLMDIHGLCTQKNHVVHRASCTHARTCTGFWF